MSNAAATDDVRTALLGLYETALPDVYGYLVRRCGSDAVAEDLTSETFLAAVKAIEQPPVPSLTVAWLIGVARHKLVDHWRRVERQQRAVRAVEQHAQPDHDEWDAHLDVVVAHRVLDELGAHHRSALTLRYLDGLSVADVADHLDRTVGATEVLLVRARTAFRNAYENIGGQPHGRRSEGPS